ncbi:MAG TPA: RNA-binding S4 domain-containing protein [Mariniphaga sp.]|nr:RNA-binding S4 domain-containing protein [Mariniphaga sp.]
MKSFILSEDYIELVKLLKLLGLADTGGRAGQLVEQGEVLVNGHTELRKRAKLRNGDKIEVFGSTIKIESPENHPDK